MATGFFKREGGFKRWKFIEKSIKSIENKGKFQCGKPCGKCE